MLGVEDCLSHVCRRWSGVIRREDLSIDLSTLHKMSHVKRRFSCSKLELTVDEGPPIFPAESPFSSYFDW